MHSYIVCPTVTLYFLYRALYIRNFIFDDIVWRFLEETKGQGQIVSLGAGFDTRYFRLKASKSFRGLYLEVGTAVVKCTFVASQMFKLTFKGGSC